MLAQDVVHAAAVSDAIRLCIPGPRACSNLITRVQFGEGLLCDRNQVKHAFQLLDRD